MARMNSSQVPGYFDDGRTVSGEADSRPFSGVTADSDPTNEPGQYPPGNWANALFGGPQPSGTNAPGTTGGGDTDADPTTEAGQLSDSFTGVSASGIRSTGAPGSPGAKTGNLGAGSDSVTFTRPGAYLSGQDASDTVSTSTSGPQDSTQANGSGYATGGPQLPGIRGNEPQAGGGKYQPQSGHVMRGGRMGHG